MYVSCNPLKLIADIDKIKFIKSALAIPHSFLTKDLIKKFKNIKLLNYEAGVQLATSGNASKILLAGFDGYGINDSRTETIEELFSLYMSLKKSKDLISVTPTQYNIKSSSIYSLL